MGASQKRAFTKLARIMAGKTTVAALQEGPQLHISPAGGDNLVCGSFNYARPRSAALEIGSNLMPSFF
jgi:hypothetical protein